MRIRRMIASDRATKARAHWGCLAYGKGAAATDPRRQPGPRRASGGHGRAVAKTDFLANFTEIGRGSVPHSCPILL